jgi:hypothetical protein
VNPRKLAVGWREKADELRDLALESEARAFERCASELERAFAEHDMKALTLQQAADESGFSYGHVQRLVTEGALENVGAPGSPRVRRGDLPRKPGWPKVGQPGLADEILARRANR